METHERIITSISITMMILAIFSVSLIPVQSSLHLVEYSILASAILSIIITFNRKFLSNMARKNHYLASMTSFGIATGIYSFQIMNSDWCVMSMSLSILFMLSMSLYISRHMHTDVVHTLHPAAAGSVIPILSLLGITNAFIVAGWLVLATGLMFFKFNIKMPKKKDKGPMMSEEVDLDKVPIFEVE